MNDLSKIDTNITSKPALVLDLDSSYLNKESYSHARNAVHVTQDGNLGTISNEPSTLKCLELDRVFCGHISLPEGRFLIFSTDNVTSEIGVLEEKTCTYKKFYESTTLGFHTDYPPIVGVAKKDFNQKTVVTFGNKNLPTRRMVLEDLPLIDEQTTLLFKQITVPSIAVDRTPSGTIPNGTYAFAIAYMIEGQRFSDFYSITPRVQLFNETGGNGILLNISNLDKEFDTYQLVIIGNVNGIVTAEVYGEFSTSTQSINVSSFLKPNYTDIPLDQLVITKETWKAAGIITANSQYLILADLVKRKELNYQPKAFNIKTEYVVKQVPLDYYKGLSKDIGYYRDEVYDFYIEWLYNTGEWSAKSHIAGRRPKPSDVSIAIGDDIYEYDINCEKPIKVPKWKVENTASKMTFTNEPFVCNQRILGYGEMAYFESTRKYPNNLDLYGESANQPIRYPKFPNESIVPRYQDINGQIYINILGVRFSNIEKPEDPDIVGYRITRVERDKSVIARGLMTNVRGYTDNQNSTEVLYTNYNVNDLSPDIFLSESQTTFKNKKEKNYKPLTKVYDDKFNFYSPHCYFNERYVLGNEFIFETQEWGNVIGNFENVYGHPEHKLLSQTAFWTASVLGALEYYISISGKINISTNTEPPEFTGNLGGQSGATTIINSADDLLTLNPKQIAKHFQDAIKATDFSAILSILDLIQAIGLTLSSVGLKIGYASLKAINYANEIIDSIQRVIGFTQYAKQFNSVANFTKSIPVQAGNRRRITAHRPLYLSSDLHSIREYTYNNFLREETVLVELAKAVDRISMKDNSRVSISSAGICDSPDSTVIKQGSAFYATSKVNKPDQYGELASFAPVVMHSGYLTGDSTDALFGGDCVIGKFSVMKKMKFFKQDLATEFGNELPPNFPNGNLQTGVEYNYNLYRNIAYPRYWIDTTKYDYSQLFRKNIINRTAFSRTATSKYNLDCKFQDDENIFRIDDAYFYLSSNCVLDFIVEADYNINFRERGDNRHYSSDNTNVSLLFRPQVSQFPEKFELSKSFYDIYTKELFNEKLVDTYSEATAFPENQPNSVIYSLPSFNLQAIDNWQYFLPGNFFSFREGDFGKLVGIHKIDQDRLIFTFTEASPFITMGRDFLELDGTGRKVTIGDGGLFAQDPREIAPTETNYGSASSRYAFKNTHLGRYYPSVENKALYSFESERPTDITEQGIGFWANKYMPLQIVQHFPSYPHLDNPLRTVGYLMIMDSVTSVIYLTKRDFIPKKEEITWDGSNFKYKGITIDIRDTTYFEDVSWTLSYSPMYKGFISFHDWHPDWTIQTNNHFLTVKNNTIWKHNQRYDSFCNFYGKDYPFEIEFISTSGQNIEVVRSLEYQLEAYKYKNFGRDKFHLLNENFDTLKVTNTEQMSPVLNLTKSTQNPYEELEFPKYNELTSSYDILFTKEENKYRINQFWDSTKDRGEFTEAEYFLTRTHPSGYKRIENLDALNLTKPEEQRKKFRHYWNKFLFSKKVSNGVQFVIKLFNVKKTISIR